MKYIKTYEAFGLLKKIGDFFTKKDPNAPKFPTDPKVIEEICKKYEFRNYNINPDGTVDVYDRQIWFWGSDDDFDVLPLKFGDITGDFRIDDKSITDLEGFPKSVGGNLNIRDCKKLTSLKGCPEVVGEGFVLSGSPLITTLDGCPRNVWGSFIISKLGLTDLKGLPHTIHGDFSCDGSKNITSLEGSPDVVGGNFNIEDCDIRSLKFAPKLINKSIHLSGNTKLYDPYGFRDMDVKGDINTLFLASPFQYKYRFGESDTYPHPRDATVWSDIEHIKSRPYSDNRKGKYEPVPPPVNNIIKLFRNFEEFKMSLDYNYVEKIGDRWVVNEWKLGEALKEFDLPLQLINYLQSSKYPKGEPGYGFVKE